MKKPRKKAMPLAILAALSLLASWQKIPQEIVRVKPVRTLLEKTGLRPDKYKAKSAQELTRQIKTWSEARDYLMNHYSYGHHCASGNVTLKDIHAFNEAFCLTGAYAGGAVLSDDARYICREVNLPRNARFENLPLIGSHFKSAHGICLVYDTQTQRYGSLGINAIDCIPPTYKSPRQVINCVNSKFLWKFNAKGYTVSEPMIPEK